MHRFRLPLTLLALASLVSPLRADRVATTERVGVRLEQGSLGRLTNRLTGESLDLGPEWGPLPSVRTLYPQTAKTQIVFSKSSYFGSADGVASYTSVRASAEGDVVLAQRATAAKPGIVSVSWGFGNVPSDTVQVIVPGFSGTAFGRNRGTPFRDLTFSWPSSWEAGFVLLQMDKGGFIIWAKDPGWHFKRLQLRHAKGKFELGFDSEAEAPFDQISELESVPWHIDAYRGDWKQGATIYRDWLRRQLKPPAIRERSPAWVGEASGMVICGMDQEVIRELAKHVVPQRTVLYVPGWRRDGYDKNYPDYTPLPQFAPFVQEAHRLGFRVMAHVNYFGCDPKHPLYETFEPCQLRTPVSDSKQWWTWPHELKKDEEPAIKFAYIHPGSKAWRQELVQRFAELVQETGVDALHLDQTLHMVNHNRGRVDGLTIPEGNLALHRELREALPDVALSGEGLDEVTFVHEAFAQRHAPRAVNHSKQTWDARFIQCTHPICSYLFAPHTTINGYLGMCNPNAGALWDAWTQSYELWGSIPTFGRPNLTQLTDPKPRSKLSLDMLSIWTRHAMLPDYDSPQTTDAQLLWQGNDASAIAAHSPQGGSALSVQTPDGQRVLYQYAAGTSSMTTPNVLPNWLVYKDNTYFGLSPLKTYLLLPDAVRSPGPHFSALPSSLTVESARATDQLLMGTFASNSAGLVLSLAEAIDEAETSLVGNGGPLPLSDGGSFQPERISDEWGVHPAIFAHPPWKNRGPDTQLPDTTCGTFQVQIPTTGNPVFSTDLALRGRAEEESDGVTYEVRVNGKSLFRHHYGKAKWEHHEVDLSAYRGQTVELSLLTSPGPDGNVQFDWALWGSPAVRVSSTPEPTPLTISSPSPVLAILDGASPLRVESKVEGSATHPSYSYTCRPALPGPVVALLKDPPVAALPLRLDQQPLSVSILDGNGAPAMGAPPFARVQPGESASLGETRQGLTAHPPGSGRTVADFVLRLPPEQPAKLRFAVGLRDGSQSTGCRFLVLVNGRTVWEHLVPRLNGWHEAEVDLSAHAGQPMVLSLAVDPAGPYNYDWAFWAEPRIVAAGQ
jgi:hypothetical protein